MRREIELDFDVDEDPSNYDVDKRPRHRTVKEELQYGKGKKIIL